MTAPLLGAQSLTLLGAQAQHSDRPALELALQMDLGSTATEALESGLMLVYRVDWQLADGRALREQIALRYSPLLRAYSLAIGNRPPQTFSLRNAMLAAFEHAKLHWDDSAPCSGDCGGRVRIAVDIAGLPAPLRIPALLDGNWAFDSGWQAVQP
jgi:hypothetical protein